MLCMASMAWSRAGEMLAKTQQPRQPRLTIHRKIVTPPPPRTASTNTTTTTTTAQFHTLYPRTTQLTLRVLRCEGGSMLSKDHDGLARQKRKRGDKQKRSTTTTSAPADASLFPSKKQHIFLSSRSGFFSSLWLVFSALLVCWWFLILPPLIAAATSPSTHAQPKTQNPTPTFCANCATTPHRQQATEE
jgi:hypothetical protein